MGITLSSGDLSAFLGNLNVAANRKENARQFDESQGLARGQLDLRRQGLEVDKQNAAEVHRQAMFNENAKLRDQDLAEKDAAVVRDVNRSIAEGNRANTEVTHEKLNALYRDHSRQVLQNLNAFTGGDPSKIPQVIQEHPEIGDQVTSLTKLGMHMHGQMKDAGPEKSAAATIKWLEGQMILSGVAGEQTARTTLANNGLKQTLTGDERAANATAVDTLGRGTGANPDAIFQAQQNAAAGVPTSTFGQEITDPRNVAAARQTNAAAQNQETQNALQSAQVVSAVEDKKVKDATTSASTHILAGGRSLSDQNLGTYESDAAALQQQDPTLTPREAFRQVLEADVKATLSQPENVKALSDAYGFPTDTSKYSPEQYQIAADAVMASRQNDEANSTYFSATPNTVGVSLSADALKARANGLVAGDSAPTLGSLLYNNKLARTFKKIAFPGMKTLGESPRQKTGVVNP